MAGKLDAYKLKFDKVFKIENDRVKAHEICAKLLEDLTQDASLLKIVLMHNLSNKDFLCQGVPSWKMIFPSEGFCWVLSEISISLV